MDSETSLYESFEIVDIDPAAVRFAYDGENLTFTDGEGNLYPCVSLRRCFPLSANDTHVLVRVPDTEEKRGHEIGILAGMDGLDTLSREAVLRELKLFY